MNKLTSVGRHRVNCDDIVSISDRPAPMRFFFTIGALFLVIYSLVLAMGWAINRYTPPEYKSPNMTSDELLGMLTESWLGWGIIAGFCVVMIPMSLSLLVYLLMLVTGLLHFIGVENRLTNWAFTHVVTVKLRSGGHVRTGLMSPPDAQSQVQEIEQSLQS